VPDHVLRPPDLVFPKGGPQIFVHEGARQSLERKLHGAAARPVLLSITDNRHSIVRHSVQQGVLRVRTHHMFLDAPAAVQDALIDYVVRGDREASHVVGRYINEHLHRLRPHRSTRTRLVTRGRHHDLLPVFDRLNATYFEGGIDALITWGRATTARGPRPRQSLKLGSYSALERIISIHPSLDRCWVPRYFVAFVVYHEMLHHVIPSVREGGRSRLHPAAFRDRERAFRLFERALAWERAHLARLLRSA
jgi:hypothetical protein